MMEQLSLFDDRDRTAPLASRLRPETLEEYVGQKHLVGPGKILRQLIEKDQISSMIFWGPPGVGKTTLARIIARQTRAEFVEFSAVTSGIKEVKEVMNQAEQNRRMGIRTLLFTDEIHRFNKAQQDAFLPFVEKGSIILVGATTENPSFEINSALLSRCKVFILKALEEDDLLELLHHALKSPKGYGNMKLSIGEEDLRAIARFANGDARTALNTLEMAVLNGRMDERAVLAQAVPVAALGDNHHLGMKPQASARLFRQRAVSQEQEFQFRPAISQKWQHVVGKSRISARLAHPHIGIHDVVCILAPPDTRQATSAINVIG